MLFCFVAESFQEAFYRRYAAHISGHRFYDDSGDVITLVIHDFPEGFDVIVRSYQSVLGSTFGDAGTIGAAEGRGAGACFDQEAIAMAVVAAFEFQNLISTGIATSSAEGAHGGFGTGVYHAKLFDGRIDFVNELSDFCFHGRRCAVGGASLRCLLDGRNHSRVGVAQNHGAPGAYIVDVSISIDVGDVRAFRRCDEGRRASHVRIGADGAIHPAGHEAASFFESGFGLGKVDHFPASSFSHFATSGAW